MPRMRHTAHEDVQIAPLPRVSIQAFCETSDVADLMQEMSQDRRMVKTHLKIQMGGAPASVEAYHNAPTPNLIIIENTQSAAHLAHNLEQLAEFCDPGTKVVVVGHVNDVQLYRDLVRRGVSEYIIYPLEPLECVQALSELFRTSSAPIGKVTAFVGSRGGVGSSTICHNVAWAISHAHTVNSVVLDLDIPFGTVGLNFNQDPSQGIADLVYAPDRIDTALVDRLLTKCSDLMSIMAAPVLLDRTTDFKDDIFDSILDIMRGSVPYTMVDMPHVWTGWSRRVLMGSEEIVIVASPDLSSLRNTKNLLDLLRAGRKNDRAPRLIINTVGVPKRPEIPIAEFSKQLEIEPMAVIGFDPALFGKAANNGQMIAEVSANSKIAETFSSIAQQLLGRAEQPKQKASLLEPFLTKLQRKKA